MSREMRKVPANWQHPRYPSDHWHPHLCGRYVPLMEGDFTSADADWLEGYELWTRGLVKNYGDAEPSPVPAECLGGRYSEWEGRRPPPDDYMPSWADEDRTHFMMYETTSEGTPKSPAFATPEELARWLTDTGASAFADMTATYDQWLHLARGGWAPSLVITEDVMSSGVAAMADAK